MLFFYCLLTFIITLQISEANYIYLCLCVFVKLAIWPLFVTDFLSRFKSAKVGWKWVFVGFFLLFACLLAILRVLPSCGTPVVHDSGFYM